MRRYEALRDRTGRTTGADARGRTLVIHQGVAAWIAAWATRQAAPIETPPPPSGRVRLEGQPSAAAALPVSMVSQLTQVLTTMVGGHLRDRRA